MGNMEFLKFLRRSLDYIGIDLIGMSVIISKKAYGGINKKIKL